MSDDISSAMVCTGQLFNLVGRSLDNLHSLAQSAAQTQAIGIKSPPKGHQSGGEIYWIQMGAVMGRDLASWGNLGAWKILIGSF